VLARLGELVPVGAARGRRVLFDVGAGTGEFLALAAEQGVFEARGNDLSASTAAYARDTRGVEVTATPLGEQPPGSADAVTMWCVLAHVPDPGLFLREAHALLRPGGVLFLRTPRWCAIDTAGMVLARVGFPKVADRRVNRRHLRIHDERDLGIALTAAGFEPLDVRPVCHYGFSADAYLDTMGRGRRGARVLDGLIDRGWFVRNTLFAYARKV
jgi:SAM-dependent methyltransferase